jgi:hypothetical protein
MRDSYMHADAGIWTKIENAAIGIIIIVTKKWKKAICL